MKTVNNNSTHCDNCGNSVKEYIPIHWSEETELYCKACATGASYGMSEEEFEENKMPYQLIEQAEQ
jgi:hypothetical protein